jgi:hypothetical protein
MIEHIAYETHTRVVRQWQNHVAENICTHFCLPAAMATADTRVMAESIAMGPGHTACTQSLPGALKNHEV